MIEPQNPHSWYKTPHWFHLISECPLALSETMAFIKKWNKKGPKGKDREKENSERYMDVPGEDEDANVQTSSFERSRRDQRNLSISRSGRHKLKKHQRATVGDVFGDRYHPSEEKQTDDKNSSRDQNSQRVHNPSAANQASSSISPGRTGYGSCRGVEPSANKLSGSQRGPPTQTAV